MKSLGQIGYEAMVLKIGVLSKDVAGEHAFAEQDEQVRIDWEITAMAIANEVYRECARIVEGAHSYLPGSPTFDQALDCAAQRIRAMVCKTPGQVAYDAFRSRYDSRRYARQLCDWSEQTEQVKQDWEFAAQTARDHIYPVTKGEGK
jgi:hypothetical protein